MAAKRGRRCKIINTHDIAHRTTGGSTCNGIRNAMQGRNPVGHCGCERNQQEDTGSSRRVCEVAADAAEQAFYHNDRNKRTDNGHPERKRNRDIKSKDHAGDNCAAIMDTALGFGHHTEKLLKNHTGNHTGCHQYECRKAEIIERCQKGRKQGDCHCEHDLLGIDRIFDMWGRGHHQLGADRRFRLYHLIFSVCSQNKPSYLIFSPKPHEPSVLPVCLRRSGSVWRGRHTNNNRIPCRA